MKINSGNNIEFLKELLYMTNDVIYTTGLITDPDVEHIVIPVKYKKLCDFFKIYYKIDYVIRFEVKKINQTNA